MDENVNRIQNRIQKYFEESYKELQDTYGSDPAVDLDLNYDDAIANTRRPVFMVRGKKITHEQAIQVLASQEPLFRGWDKDNLTAVDNAIFDDRGERGSLRTCLFRQGYHWLSSWLLSDGTIGGNILEFKYPELWEFLPEWVELAKACPFLDMAVGYTTVNESLCYMCKYSEIDYQTNDYDDDDSTNLRPGEYDEYDVEKLCVAECRRRKEFLKTFADRYVNWRERRPEEYEYHYGSNFACRNHHRDMYKYVRGCLIIKDGRIGMWWGDEAYHKFKEYYDKYRDPYLDGLYGQQITESGMWHIYSKQDIIDAFALNGLPAECYDISVKNNFITEIPDDAPILTADWLRKEHKKMCEKWNIPLE